MKRSKKEKAIIALICILSLMMEIKADAISCGVNWNADTGICCAANDAYCKLCSGTDTWDDTKKRCCVSGDTACSTDCAADKIWNHALKKCCASNDFVCQKCSGTDTWDDTKKRCCASGDTACSTDCAADKIWNHALKVCCASNDFVCQECSGTDTWDDTKKRCCASGDTACSTDCAADKIWNHALKVCCASNDIACQKCSGTDTWDDTNKRCCASGDTACSSCPLSNFWDDAPTKCCESNDFVCLLCFGIKQWNFDFYICCEQDDMACLTCSSPNKWNHLSKKCCTLDDLACLACPNAIPSCMTCLSPMTWFDKLKVCCHIADSICNYCDSSDYASGIYANKKSCICSGNLKWNNKTNTCGCSKYNEAIVKINNKYQCKTCSGKILKTPVIDGTKCTCPQALTWSDTAADCTCPDDATQVYSNNRCITCDATINAKDKKSANECNCLSSILKWRNSACECLNLQQITIVSAQGTVSCELCNSLRIKGTSKVTGSNQCKCPNNLIWDSTTLSCICISDNFAIQGLTGSEKCVCKGIAIQPYNEQPCVLCQSGYKISPYECKCVSPQIWNNYQNVCIDPPAGCTAIASSGMSCKCKSPLIFDVVTKQCIATCSGSPLCLDCSKIPYTAGQAINFNPLSSSVRTVLQFKKIGTVQYGLSTNYNVIKAYMCPCISNYKWDRSRIACISTNVL